MLADVAIHNITKQIMTYSIHSDKYNNVGELTQLLPLLVTNKYITGKGVYQILYLI